MSILDRLKCLWKGHEYAPVLRTKLVYCFGHKFCDDKKHKRKGGWKEVTKVKYYRCVRCGKKITITKARELLYNGNRGQFLYIVHR